MTRPERLVLIVDDSPGDREAVRRYLKKDLEFDYRFVEEASGVDGLRACRDLQPACVLLDYELPDLNGLQFLGELTGGTDRSTVPVVMLTGRGGETVAVLALKRGAQDYLVKGSYSPETLRKTVDDAIRRVADRNELDRQRVELERLYAEAREADARNDEFLAMLAHELRNPLAPIRNAVQVMKRAEGDRAILDQMREIIERQVSHLARLVDDLLDVSRITRGKILLRLARVDLADILAQAVDNVRPSCEQRGQSLAFGRPPGPVWVEADATRVEQVFINLLSNASKYTDPGGAIRVQARAEACEAVVVVQDNGIGIAPEMLGRVFELFVQAERSLDRSQGGLGIGLTLVEQLVRSHGGRVEAASEGAGRGSTFTVRFPMDPVPPDTSTSPSSADSATGEGTAPRGSLRVLIVDDNVHSADSLALVVNLWDLDARVAYDGRDALAILDEYRPQVVLLDIGLPGMDGYAIARAIRARPDLDGIALVAMTGYGRDEDIERSKAVGFDLHLVKPIDFAVLETLLATIVDELRS